MLAVWFGAAFSSWCLLALPAAAQGTEISNRGQGGWPRPTHSHGQTISTDILRHPISYKTRGMLQHALDSMRSGNHQEAIHQLENTLAKDPASAPYVHSLLGYEYMKTDQFADAVKSFEQAVTFLPHDAINRANFGVSLAATGDYERAKEQARRALELEPDNATIQRFLDALLAESARAEP